MARLRLLLLILALVTLAAGLPPRPAAAQEPVQQMRAFWVDSLNPGFYNHPQVDELVNNVVRAGARRGSAERGSKVLL